MLLATALLTNGGCATYAVYANSYSSGGPTRETMGILLGVESVVGVATGIGMAIRNRRERAWGENAAIGFLVPFIVDAAIALGIGTSDFVGE